MRIVGKALKSKAITNAVKEQVISIEKKSYIGIGIRRLSVRQDEYSKVSKLKIVLNMELESSQDLYP